MVVPSGTRENVYPWLGTLPSMQKWAGDRIIRNLKAHKYSIENEKFEMTIAVKRDDIEDDQVGIYGRCSATWARRPGSIRISLCSGRSRRAMSFSVMTANTFSTRITPSTVHRLKLHHGKLRRGGTVVPHVYHPPREADDFPEAPGIRVEEKGRAQ